MSIEVKVQIPKPVVLEGDYFEATIYYRASGSASANSSLEYRIDCMTTGTEIKDWTPATSATATGAYVFAVDSTPNRIIDRSNANEKRLITVVADRGTGFSPRDNIEYIVNNRGWRDT